ncbi:MAG: transcriptional repressor LexA [Endozoicomonas sp. (ex Botrylloides leachii)]|nr:transcriptional repressor LexA [Endozoicomonas sp. (ex Botrylloides leachii)]
MIKLTKRQAEILSLIKSYIEDSGFPPTRAEIAEILGFKSPNAAEEHLRTLERKGAIKITPGISRGIKIPELTIGIPIIGQVAAGSPLLAQEHIENHLDINPHFFSPMANFFLRVTGMSMKDVGILDGDLLAVHKTPEAKNGQIVVARIGDEVTVKRFEQQHNNIFLHPENSNFDTIKVNLKTDFFAIEGLSVGVIRN